MSSYFKVMHSDDLVTFLSPGYRGGRDDKLLSFHADKVPEERLDQTRRLLHC